MSSIASRSDTSSHPPSPHAVSSPANSITPQLSASGDSNHNLPMPTTSLPPASASASASTSQLHAPPSVPSPSTGHSAFSAASGSRPATSSTPIPGSYLVTSLVTPSGTIPLQAQPVTDSTHLFATSSSTTTQGANSSQQQTQTAPVALRPKDFEVTVPTAFRALPSATSGTMSMSNLMVTPKMSPAAHPLGAQIISVPSPQLTIQPQGVAMGAPLQHFGYPLLSFPTSQTLLVQMPQASSEFLMPYMTAQGSMVNMMAMNRLTMDTTPRPVLATSQPALAVQTAAAMAVDNSGSKTPTSNNGSLKVPNTNSNFGSPWSAGHHKMSSAASASSMLLKLRAQASSSLSLQSVNSTHSSASSGSRTPEAHGDEELRFGCTQCGNAFKNKGGLTRHMRVHTGEKPYMCTMCGKRFNQKGHLTIHFRSHTGETPFSCEDCAKHFKTRSDMKRHQRVHTGEKNFACPTCSRRFTRKTGLKKHVCGSVPGQTAASPAASS